jgi:hypothetical protein
MFSKYEKFDDAASPLVEAHAIGGDGIHTIEAIADHKLNRCTLYKDKGIPKEMRYTSYDPFVNNQWSESTNSWGANGTLLPHGINSYTYKSLLDSEGIGIVCAYDEIYISAFWYARATSENWAFNYFELLFMPREINKSDLLMLMIKRNCCRPCDEPETVDELPCKEDCKNDCGLKDSLEVKDDEMVDLPTGKVTGKQYKDRHPDRLQYNGCLEVCISGGSEGGGVSVVKIDPTQNTVKIDKESALKSGIDLNWKPIKDQFEKVGRDFFRSTANLSGYADINLEMFNIDNESAKKEYNYITTNLLHVIDGETPATSTNAYKDKLKTVWNRLAEVLVMLDPTIFGLATSGNKQYCIPFNCSEMHIKKRYAGQPRFCLTYCLYLLLIELIKGRLMKVMAESEHNELYFPNSTNWDAIPFMGCNDVSRLMLNKSISQLDWNYAAFVAQIHAEISRWCYLTIGTKCKQDFFLQVDDGEPQDQMGPSPPETDGLDATQPSTVPEESPKSPEAERMDADDQDGAPEVSPTDGN